jgi:hypothetical protein
MDRVHHDLGQNILGKPSVTENGSGNPWSTGDRDD